MHASVWSCSWIWWIPPPQSKWGKEASIYISSCCHPPPLSLMSLLLLISHSWIKINLMKRFRNVNSPCSKSTSRSTETRRCTHHKAVVIATAAVEHEWVMLSNQPYLRLLGKDINLWEDDTDIVCLTLCQALFRPVGKIWFFET